MDNMVTKEERVNQLRTKINSRIYKDNEPKLKRANKIFYITYLLMQLGMLGNIFFLIFVYGGTALMYIGTVWSIAGMVVCTVFYLRDQANPNMSNICILQFVVTYFIAIIRCNIAVFKTICIKMLSKFFHFLNSSVFNDIFNNCLKTYILFNFSL